MGMRDHDAHSSRAPLRWLQRHVGGEILGSGSVNQTNVNDNGPPVGRRHFFRDVLRDLSREGSYIPDDIKLINQIFDDGIRNGGLSNDREYQMEQLIQFASRRQPHSGTLKDVNTTMIDALWNNLQHPPLSYLGDLHRYRTADGSYNNPHYPNLGKAGSYYARSVNPMVEQPAVLPDPSLIFDTIFARKENAREHPNKISSFLFYLASIIIHDIFRTDEIDPCKHKTSAYLDLAPLYGSNEKEQNSVRTMEDGLLKPDTFAEIRLLAFPPGVCALLVCFNRFHNYVAQQLATINEGGRFSMPEGHAHDPSYEAARKKRDNDLFQTARLVTGGLYVNIILHDYVRTILNLNRTNSSWTLDPRETWNDIFDDKGAPQGVGNEVSVEFNLVYRWHSAMSVKDERWTNDVYAKLFEGKEPSTLTQQDLAAGLMKWAHSLPKEPAERTFGDLTRGPSGSFDDNRLVQILTDATNDVAGAFGARNVPVVMKAVECLGMEQARSWKVATLNEFRKFFKLEPHKTFEDISSDADIQASLEALYGLPDYVELYPGLVAEDTKAPMIGSGLCPGFTTSRTILADAVALVRGDRFYTVGYTPANLTSWGYNQAKSDPDVAGSGVLYKLLMRTFPNHYKGNSVYALYPMVHPEENRKILTDLGTVDQYDFSEPELKPPPKIVSTWHGVTEVLGDPSRFEVPWGPHTLYLTGHDYMLNSDKPEEAVERLEVKQAMYCPSHGMEEFQSYYEDTTTKLVEHNSRKLGDFYQLDAVRDVGNPSHAMFVANLFKIPLTEPQDKHQTLTAQQLYQILGALFAYVFLDVDPASDFFLRKTSKKYTDKLAELVRAVVLGVKIRDIATLGTDPPSWFDNPILQHYGVHMIKRLLDSEPQKSIDEIAGEIIPTAAAACATQGQGFAQMLDLYLSDGYKHHWNDIRRCAHSTDPKDFETLKRYALEGYRLATPAFGLLRTVIVDSTTIHDGDKVVHVKKGDQVYTNFISAGVDPAVFPDPHLVKLDRDPDKYIHHGYGSHSCLGRPIVEAAMASQLRVFGRLRNLRRAPGPAGTLKSQTVQGIFKTYMKEDWSDWVPFPVSLRVLHDGFEEIPLTPAQTPAKARTQAERCPMPISTAEPSSSSSPIPRAPDSGIGLDVDGREPSKIEGLGIKSNGLGHDGREITDHNHHNGCPVPHPSGDEQHKPHHNITAENAS